MTSQAAVTLSPENQERADRIKANFQALASGRDRWMPLMPQAAFLFFRPIGAEGKDQYQKDGFDTEQIKSREGIIYSYNCLVKKTGDIVPSNILSGTRVITAGHLGIAPRFAVALENAAPYALGRLLWRLNHGKWKCNTGSTKGLHIYCQEEAALILTQGIENGFKEASGVMCLHNRHRDTLNHLVQRIGPENLTVTATYPDDEKPLRKKWYHMGRQCCVMGEKFYTESWKDSPPPGWRVICNPVRVKGSKKR